MNFDHSMLGRVRLLSWSEHAFSVADLEAPPDDRGKPPSTFLPNYCPLDQGQWMVMRDRYMDPSTTNDLFDKVGQELAALSLTPDPVSLMAEAQADRDWKVGLIIHGAFYESDREQLKPVNPWQVFSNDTWGELRCAKYWCPDIPLEVTEEVWDYWLEVLPPILMPAQIRMPYDTPVDTPEGYPTWKSGDHVKFSYVMGEGVPLMGGLCHQGRHFLVALRDGKTADGRSMDDVFSERY